MSLNPDIKKLCDKSLEKLFSLKSWEKINIFVIYKLYLNNC